MSVTPAHLASTDRNRLHPVARLALALLTSALLVLLLGHGLPAGATTPVSTTPTATSTATSTENVGPDLGWAQDTVYVQSTASSRWPVKAATQRLSKGTHLKLVFVASCPVRTSAAQPAVQCITVSSADLGGGTLAGNTKWTFAKSTNKLTSATVVYNDRWAKRASAADRLNIAEHELGHGVGLPHVKRRSSIMNAVAHGRTTPDAGDLRALKERY